MATQGILAQSKPAANTDTVLYSAPIDQSASTALTIANDGTGSTFDVAIKNFDQKMTVGASTYLLHEGDVITGYRVKVDTAIAISNSSFTPGASFTTDSKEDTFKFESFYTPDYEEIFVKEEELRAITLTSVSGTFAVGDTISKGTSPNDTTAVVYDVTGEGTITITIGVSDINGSGTEFAVGDSISVSGGASGTIDTDGIGTGNDEFIFSTTTSGGTYNMFKTDTFTLFTDRAYRFDVSDSSMTGISFKISETENGEYGPDGDFSATDDNGTEYTTGKTTNGTPGSAGAYIQYDFSANNNVPDNLYFYEGTTAANAGADYGGADRLFTMTDDVTFDEIYVYDIDGTLTNTTDSFTTGGTTYTIDSQTSGAYGYVRSYDSTTLYVIKGVGSADFTTSSTFQDNPKDEDADRTAVTVSSIDVATAAVESENYIAVNHANAANNDERITSIVVGPGERVVVNSTTQNNVFSLIGFEDLSTTFTTRVFPGGGTSAGAGA